MKSSNLNTYRTKAILTGVIFCTAYAASAFAEAVIITQSSTADTSSDHARNTDSDKVLQLESREQNERLQAENPQQGVVMVPVVPVRVNEAVNPNYDNVTVTETRTVDTRTDLTPLDQSNEQSDLALTQRIRQALIAQETLSMDAKNLKVITINGQVTLRGQVENTEEKTRIENMVRDMAGPQNTVSQIGVAAKS